jgi:prepilin-type processing-associated H-X9-DG protein/prepilin-type N-terminal cleavage/methylation domain-containing protein
VKNRGFSSGSGLRRRGAERRSAAFTLIELLVAIAVIAILAALLLPALSRAKESARNVNCQSNLKQLQLCWVMYADDYGGLFVPNNWIETEGIGEFAQASWCEGNARTDTTTSNIQNGLLFPYATSAGIYHCPSDVSTIEDAKGNPLPQLRTRSYNMSQSVNSYGLTTNTEAPGPVQVAVDAVQPCFMGYFAVTNPPLSQLFVFLDENEGTLDDDQFGYPCPGYYGLYMNCWWDMPSNRHTQGANFSFADGHVEHWKWHVPMTASAPPGTSQQILTGQMPDYLRVGSAMRIITVDGTNAL